ncbi:hypothetical protein BN873_p10018 [Candidatus Competibacter denitrificans Run_A_D11]|uniref:Uncharacterized protein n=1 Tax=Candidatus Competibacter denitrificans Run_A_D11 TaxID=1400863 RepID=W6MBY0_9GAMM|nr:hypothetical protein [Candidatus Competibacter denitrificans]CDI04574.1 hypothetical protein BN873_p10018 [Candidatus Competibacter denitrificans Run_A_D11]HRZ05960.1 hypothetical protein [Candidatus Competibacteraceae bacterium]
MKDGNETSIPDDDEPEPLDPLDESGWLIWTDEGRHAYRRRFARFGNRIETLQTFEDYRTAMRLSARVFMEDTLGQWAERAAGKPWHELRVAALTGDSASVERARRRYETRQKLFVIS